MAQELEAAGHIVFTVSKQREKNVRTQLTPLIQCGTSACRTFLPSQLTQTTL